MKLIARLEPGSLFSTSFVDLVQQIGPDVEGAIVHSRDYAFS